MMLLACAGAAEMHSNGLQGKSFNLLVAIDHYRTKTYHTIILFVGLSKILHKHCLHFLFGVKMAPRETKNNAYAKFWSDQQRVLWYVVAFSVVVNFLPRVKVSPYKKAIFIYSSQTH